MSCHLFHVDLASLNLGGNVREKVLPRVLAFKMAGAMVNTQPQGICGTDYQPLYFLTTILPMRCPDPRSEEWAQQIAQYGHNAKSP